MSAKKKLTDEKAQPGPIKLVKLNKAYKLAMQWVNNMSEDEQTEVELEGRPYKLGLGAEISHRTEVKQPNNEAIEWKLRAMLDPSKRKTSIHEGSAPNNKKTYHSDSEEEEEEEDDKPESRSNAFAKKRVTPMIAVVSRKKRGRKY